MFGPFLRSIPARIMRAYRNTLAASSFIEQNKNLKESFRRSAERPTWIWLAGMVGFVVAWVATGLRSSDIRYHTTVGASMFDWFITHIILLQLVLWSKCREALLELRRFRQNQIMHRIYEVAEERTSGGTITANSFVTGVAQGYGEPYIVKCYKLDDVSFWFVDVSFWFVHDAVEMVNNRSGNTAILFSQVQEFVQLADMFVAMNTAISDNRTPAAKEYQC